MCSSVVMAMSACSSLAELQHQLQQLQAELHGVTGDKSALAEQVGLCGRLAVCTCGWAPHAASAQDCSLTSAS